MKYKRFFSPIHLNFTAISNYLFTAPHRYLLQYGHNNLFLFHTSTHPSVCLRYFEPNKLKLLAYKLSHYLCVNVLPVKVS